MKIFRNLLILFLFSQSHIFGAEAFDLTAAKNYLESIGCHKRKFNNIHEAAQYSSKAALEYLKSHPKEVNNRNKDGQTALMILAAKVEQWPIKVVRKFMKLGADLTITDNDGNNVAMVAAKNHNDDFFLGLRIGAYEDD